MEMFIKGYICKIKHKDLVLFNAKIILNILDFGRMTKKVKLALNNGLMELNIKVSI